MKFGLIAFIFFAFLPGFCLARGKVQVISIDVDSKGRYLALTVR